MILRGEKFEQIPKNDILLIQLNCEEIKNNNNTVYAKQEYYTEMLQEYPTLILLFCYIILGYHSRTMLLAKSLLILLVAVFSINNMKIINFGLFLTSVIRRYTFKICICYVSFTYVDLWSFRNLTTIVFHNAISQ